MFRDYGVPTQRQLYDGLTQRLAQKLARGRTALIAPGDVVQVTDILESRQDRPDDAQFWLSLRADGTVINTSASVLPRLGLRSAGELEQKFRPRLRGIDGDADFLSLPDAMGRTILCRTRRAAGAHHWLIEEMVFPANPDLGNAIARLWGFSPWETAIALALLSGEQATEIAVRTDRAVGTVRKGIKTVLTKMHAQTQAKATVRLALVAADWQTHLAGKEAPQPLRHVVPHRDATGSALYY
ncbi:MAG: hypothetical protein P3W94_011705 [Paracoccus sp. (in: a-proteobacteria)]|nr:hypothetical protein [Paracoccus sp. (in: a-proteobacteria)]